MKYIFIIAIAGVLFTSCNKKYTCQCISPKETLEFEMAVSRKVDANDKCLQYQRQYNAYGTVDASRSQGTYTCTVQ